MMKPANTAANAAPSTAPSNREDARAAFVHQLCVEIDVLRAAGLKFLQAVSRVRRRRRKHLFSRGRLSAGALIRNYYLWRHLRTPESVRRKYGNGPPPRIPLALIDEFLNRMVAGGVVPAYLAIRSLKSDWQRGLTVPGLGTWKQYWSRRHASATPRRMRAPAFPVGMTSFYEILSAMGPAEYQRRISAAVAAQRELDRYAAFVEGCRSALRARRAQRKN